MTLKSPVIRGTVPADYRGPLHYRRITFLHQTKKPLQQMLNFDDRNMGQRLCNVNFAQAAWRMSPQICDANGNLLPDLQTPVKAKLKASASKTWDELSAGSIVLVSRRIQEIIETIAPGVHYFVPIDVSDREGGTFRVYAFYCGATLPETALAMEANGITRTKLPDGGLRFEPFPDWITGFERFGYLDSKAIAGVPLLYDPMLGILYSPELVERLGDCIPKGEAFVPMGLV
jgi:hypothetical protein